MNGTTVSYQWCLEMLGKRTGEILDTFYASELSDFEEKFKLIKKGELCLLRTESEGNVIKEILWSYVQERIGLEPFKNAFGKEFPDVTIPDRFVMELQRFMNKTRTHTKVRKQKKSTEVEGRRIPERSRFIKQSKPIIVKVNPTEGKIPVRINKKTIIYVDKDCSVQDIDEIIKKYSK